MNAFKDWSVKYEQDGPVQPRFEINAPDLYIPSMAYVTYILVAGLVLGKLCFFRKIKFAYMYILFKVCNKGLVLNKLEFKPLQH